VTLTHQKGWIACFPANKTFNGTPSINWFGDFQDLANNAFVEIPNDGVPATDGKIKFTPGGIVGAEAHLVVDLIGASAPIDYGSGAVAGAVSAYQTPWTLD
jgi:hypothetical protein